MEGDKLLFRDEHFIKAEKILENIPLLKNKKIVIAIGGESGTGKSEVAHILREKLYDLGISAFIISLDDYYFTHWNERNKIRQQKGIDSVGKKEIDWEILDNIIETFRDPDKKECCVRRINKYTNSIEYITFYNNVNVLIVEGLYALEVDADYKVYLDGSYKDTKDFREKRKKEEQTSFRQLVLQKEREEVLSTKHKADLIISLKGDIIEKEKN